MTKERIIDLEKEIISLKEWDEVSEDEQLEDDDLSIVEEAFMQGYSKA